MGDVPNVDEPWRSGVKVTELTNTDLVDSRNAPVTFSDSKREYRHDITALANSQNINKSAAADRAIRVELAAAIDNGRVPFSREDFNIAYMIPPKRWVREKLSTYDAKIPRSEEIDTEQRHINVTTTPTVKQMMEAAVEAESYESKSDIIKNGINRYLEHPLAVEVLFATESRREILHAFFNTDNDWLRKADIVNKKSVSSESARINIEKLQSLGVIQARDPEVNIVHYSLTDNQVVNLLNKSDIPIKKLNKIFGSSSRRDLVSFFLDRSDPDEWYTRYSLKNEININYKTSKKHLPVLIQEDVLNSRDGSRGTEYQLAKTDTTRLLRQLNTMIVETALLD